MPDSTKLLRPFFSYYGGKWRSAIRYPPPQDEYIIEPFAGSAGYSLRYPDKEVILVELYEVLVMIWDYLIHVSEEDILRLPDLPAGGTVDDIEVCEEASYLIGFCVNPANATPCKRLSSWGRTQPDSVQFWNHAKRTRIADQLHAIRHWTIIHGSYEDTPDIEGTWFIDPPYVQQGGGYKEHDIDYDLLAQWCRTRRGQVIVCEGNGADWLPFEHLYEGKKAHHPHHKNKTSPEYVWTRGCTGCTT